MSHRVSRRVVFGVFAATMLNVPLAVANGSDPLQQVRTTWEQAMLTGNAGAAAAVFAETAVQMRPARPTNRGRPSIEAGYAEDFAGAAVTAVRMRPSTTDVIGERALEHGTFTITWLERAAGAKPLELRGRYLLWARRSAAGNWQIEFEMHTVERELPESDLR